MILGSEVEECGTEHSLCCCQLLESCWLCGLHPPTETKVAGRNVTVKTAAVFIAELSLCTASLILTMSLLSCCAIVLKALWKLVLSESSLCQLTHKIYFIIQPCFSGFGPSSQATQHLESEAQILRRVLHVSCIRVSIEWFHFRKPFVLAKDTGHSLDCNLKGFRGVDHMPCKVVQ